MKKNIYFAFFLLVALASSVQSVAQERNYAATLATHRANYVKNLVTDGPIKQAADTSFVDFFLPDEAYRVAAIFRPKKGKPFNIPTSSGKEKPYQQVGELRFKIDGKKQRLAVYSSLLHQNHPLYKDYLFLPFKDATNKVDTYGGGRYLDLFRKDLAGKTVIIDFNKAYNPYCAFSEGYSCPIPPKANHLEVAIRAGEKNYKKPME